MLPTRPLDAELRPKLIYRVAAVWVLACTIVVPVFTGEQRNWAATATWAILTLWINLQRITVVDGVVSGQWTLYRGPISLSDVSGVFPFRAKLARGVQICSPTRQLRLQLWWWNRWRDLLDIVGEPSFADPASS